MIASIIAVLLHIEPFGGILKQKLCLPIHISSNFFPLSVFIGGLCHE